MQLKGLQLSHAEDVRQREEEMEAQYAGQMAYLKLHHKEEIEEMQTNHTSEVCVCMCACMCVCVCVCVCVHECVCM